MDVRIIHNGSNITKQVVSYETNHKLCNSTGQLTLTVEPTTASAMNTWDTVNVYESYHRGEYFISSIQDNIPDGKAIITCQDASKKLVDTFIEESYTFEDTLEYTGTWINKFLHDAGVTGNAGTGQLMSNYSELGLKSVMAQVTELLQMSGWYMYFSDSNTAVIGKISKDFSNYDFLFDETELLNVVISKNDKMLRNRAVVMGGYDPFLGTTVIADGRTHTPWNYDHGDLRTAVVSNSNIPNMKSAKKIATDMINEFAHLTVEKHLVVAGLHNVRIGDVVAVNSKAYRGAGIVTTVGTSVSREGAVTNIILDERCPRLFAFFDFGDYVYIGTDGDGVWRKHIFYTHIWEDFSSGLIDKHITDLHIANGVMTCVTSNGDVYKRFPDSSSWSKIVLPSMETWLESESGGWGSGYIPGSEIKARASVVDRQTGKIYIACDSNSSDNKPFYEDRFGPCPSGVDPEPPYEFTGIAPDEDDRAWLYVENDSRSKAMNYRNRYDLRAWDIETNSNGDKYISLTTPLVKDGDFGFYNSGAGFYDSQHSEMFYSQPVFASGSPAHVDFTGSVGIAGIYDNISSSGVLGSGTAALYYGGETIYAHRVFISDDNNLTSLLATMTLSLGTYEQIVTSQKVTGTDTKYNIYTVVKSASYGKVDIEIKRYTIDVEYETTTTGSILHSATDVVLIPHYIKALEGEIGVAYYKTVVDDLVVHDYDGVSYGTIPKDLVLGGTAGCYDTKRIFGFISYSTKSGNSYTIEHEQNDLVAYLGGIFFQDESKLKAAFFYTEPLEKELTINSDFVDIVYDTTVTGVEGKVVIFDNDGNREIINYGELSMGSPYPINYPNYIYATAQPNKYECALRLYSNFYDEEGIYVYGNGSKIFNKPINTDSLGVKNLQDYIDISVYHNEMHKVNITTLKNSGKILPNGENLTFIDFLFANDATDDSMMSEITYILAKNSEGTYGVAKMSKYSFTMSSFVPFPATFNPPDYYQVAGIMVGNFVFVSTTNPATSAIKNDSFYFYNEGLGKPAVVVGVDSEDHLLELHESTTPSRLDVSLYSPLYVVDRDAMSQSAYYIYNGGDVVGYHNWSYSGIAPYADLIDDFRYMPYAATSGELSELVAMYSVEGNAYYADMLTFSEVSGIILYSGIQMLETTNYMPPDQTIFASVSGGAGFYQKDVNSSVFESRTDALPSSPITIIRVDDRL